MKKKKRRLFLNHDGCLHVIIRLYRLDYEYWTARHNRGRCTSGISGNRGNRQSTAKNIGRMTGRQWDEIMAAQDIGGGGGGAVIARHNRSQVAERFVERPTEIRVLHADKFDNILKRR